VPEQKLIQITLTEREAEAVAGAIATAITITEGSTADVAVELGKKDKIFLIRLDGFQIAEDLACAQAGLCGIPCPQHDKKTIPLGTAVDGQTEGLSLLRRIGKQLHEASLSYRQAKIDTFAPAADPEHQH
jgi:hypothetical protein